MTGRHDEIQVDETANPFLPASVVVLCPQLELGPFSIAQREKA
jgi:hypothetical protein